MPASNKYSLLQAKKDLPRVNPGDHKSRGGKTLLIAGSVGMWGAAILAAQACSRSGAGYVYLWTLAKKFPFQKNPDFLQFKKSLSLDTMTAVAIGPGFDHKLETERWLKKLKKQKMPVVLDAEALNTLAKMKAHPLPSNWILTPHEGELSRLLKVSSDEAHQNRKYYVSQAQKKWGCVVLLKGHRTLVAGPEKIYEIQSGNAALAKAGTGDVLTGIILAFLSQGLTAEKAACLAAYIHGRIADRWLQNKKDVLSLMASDLVDQLPQELHHIRASL